MVDIEEATNFFGEELLSNCCTSGASHPGLLELSHDYNSNSYSFVGRCAECGEGASFLTNAQWEIETPSFDDFLISQINSKMLKYRNYLEDNNRWDDDDQYSHSQAYLPVFKREYQISKYKTWKMKEMLKRHDPTMFPMEEE